MQLIEMVEGHMLSWILGGSECLLVVLGQQSLELGARRIGESFVCILGLPVEFRVWFTPDAHGAVLF